MTDIEASLESEKLKATLGAAVESLRVEREEGDRLRQEQQGLTTALAELQAHVARLTEDHKSACQAMESQTAELAIRETRLVELGKTSVFQQEQLSALTAENQLLMKRLAETETAFQQIQYAGQANEAAIDEIGKLRLAEQQAREALEQERGIVAHLRSECDKSEARLKESEVRLGLVDQQFQTEKASRQALAKELESEREKIRQQQEEHRVRLESLADQKVAEAEARLAAEMVELRQQLESAIQDSRAKATRLLEMESTLAGLSDAENASVSKEEELRRLTSAMSELEQTLVRERDESERLRQVATQMQDRLKDTESQVAHLDEVHKVAVAQRLSLEREMGSRLEEASRVHAGLEDQLASTREALARQEQHVAELQLSLSSAHEALSAVDALRAENEQLAHALRDVMATQETERERAALVTDANAEPALQERLAEIERQYESEKAMRESVATALAKREEQMTELARNALQLKEQLTEARQELQKQKAQQDDGCLQEAFQRQDALESLLERTRAQVELVKDLLLKPIGPTGN